MYTQPNLYVAAAPPRARQANHSTATPTPSSNPAPTQTASISPSSPKINPPTPSCA
jgi:hypothetical protein